MRASVLLQKKKTFEIIFILVLLLLGIITFFSQYITKGTSQQSIFYYDKSDYFMDYFNQLKYISQRDVYKSSFQPLGEKIYPPLAYLILYPFSQFIKYVDQSPKEARFDQMGIMSVVFFLVFSCIILFYFLYELKTGKKAVRFLTVFFLFTSGISLFSLERANIVYLAVICLVIFLLFYKDENRILREISYIALAFSFSIKITPVLFGILLIYKKRYRDAIRLVIYCFLFFFLPFLFFQGGLTNIGLLIKNIEANTALYMFNGFAYRFGFIPASTLFGVTKPELYLLFYFGLGLFLLALCTSWSLEKYWKMILLLSSALILTPANSGFYTGLYLFIPIILFLNDQEHILSDWIYLILIIIVLNPYQIIVENVPISSWLSNISVIIIYLFLLKESIVSTIKFIGPIFRKNNFLNNNLQK